MVPASVYLFLFFILGLLLLVFPAFYIGVILSLNCIVIVLENTAPFESFKRSANLIRGFFWPVFIIQLILWIFLIPMFCVNGLNIGDFKIWLISFIISVPT
jgi:hypothetical protein